MQKYRIELKWAIIFMATTLVWMILEKLVGLHSTHIDKHMIYTNFFAIPAIIIYVLALLDKRKNFYGGQMTYQQGFLTGLWITLIVTIFSPLTQYIISTVITPDYFSTVIDYVITHDMMTEEAARKQFNLKNYIIQATIGALIMGVVTSAIVAIFTRKRANP
ncbi:MAG TPA: DUF4199 domain-containing protein [Saprospiraceae bacterium]|nr:DUF4199 domain-containing protein [Saprospiraceae bacterium]